MYFGLSEEQVSLQETIKKYLEDQAPLEVIKEIAAGDELKTIEIHKGLLDLGIRSLLVPEEFGGLELDLLFAAVVSTALGSGTAPGPFIGAYVMAPLALNLGGNQSQKEQWLPKIASGELLMGIAISEFIGAREDSGINFKKGKVNGRALFAIDAKNSDALIVSNKAGQLFLVDTGSSGISQTELITVDKTRISTEILFKDVKAEILPESEKDLGIINKVIDAGRIMLAADSLGAAQVMLDKAVAYSLERKQFGRQIGSFQAVKHMCAEMVAELEPCNAMVWHASHCQENIPHEARLMACHTKAHISEVSREVSKTAIEVHGGMGFTDELGLHYWFKRIGLNRQLLGSPDLVREEAAKIQNFDQASDDDNKGNDEVGNPLVV